MRNCLEAYKELSINNAGTAKWSDIVQLHKQQVTEGLRTGNKLTEAHIKFQQQKMKVKLAAQTLSASVANSLLTLQILHTPGFENTIATQVLVSRIDQLFDLLNSRTPMASGFKKALTASGLAISQTFLAEVRNMLLTMTDTANKLICEGKRHMAALGFVINIDSLNGLGSEILRTASKPSGLKYLLTYKLSQDHLE